MALDLHHTCAIITSLGKSPDSQYSENSFAVNCSGKITEKTRELLQSLAKLITTENLEAIRLKVDDFDESWDEIDFSTSEASEWTINLTDKSKLLQAALVTSVDLESLLFLSLDYFTKIWLPNVSGLLGGELESAFKAERPLKIFIHGLEAPFGGPRTAIIPTKDFTQPLPAEWLSSTKLPQPEKILKQVHFVSNNTFTTSPEKFLLSWGRINPEIASYFDNAFSTYALISLCQEFYNWEKVILKGKRKLEISAQNKELKALKPTEKETLINCVEWCYAESDEETRILLVIDRLSLDTKEGSSLIDAVRLIPAAFTEARSRYKYVVLDRKKDYTKELSDIQKDLSGVVDKFVSTSNNFAGSLLTDILALAFVLTAGVVSRRFIAEDALRSPEAVILFKSFSVYLAIAMLLRVWGAISVSLISARLFTDWKKIVRSHMSADELQSMIDNSLFPVKVNFWISCGVIVSTYILMALACWNAELTLSLFGVLERS